MRALRLGLWFAAAALCSASAFELIHRDLLSPAKSAVYYLALFVAISAGLYLWQRRPQNRIGVLLTAGMFTLPLSELDTVFPGSALAVTVAYATAWIGGALLAQLTLSYPTGRLTSRLDRGFVAIAYVYAAVFSLLYLLLYSPRSTYDREIYDCFSCADPYTHVAWADMHGPRRVLDRVAVVIIGLFVVLAVRKLVRLTPGARGVTVPFVVAVVYLAVRLGVEIGLKLDGTYANFWTSRTMFWLETVGILVVPLALAAGVLWERGARSAVADLVVELEHTPPGSVREALARTLGDPSLELALWLPDRRGYVDPDGRPVELPTPGSNRAATVLGDADAPVAALVHDPVLLERRSLLVAAGAAARLALENERLQAELRAQLAELHASRARIVSAGDEERRRLERDLHDGAQQRLLSLGLALQLVRSELGPGANGAAELLGEADAELGAAIEELRELAQGIHPAVLTEQGLAPALRTLAARSTLPVEIGDVPEERLPGPVEAAAYFVVSEALANVAKHAHASVARVSVSYRDGLLVVDVTDDGAGGAQPTAGSGLSGLADRVHALDGRLTIVSKPGSGTRLRAELPCAERPAATLGVT